MSASPKSARVAKRPEKNNGDSEESVHEPALLAPGDRMRRELPKEVTRRFRKEFWANVDAGSTYETALRDAREFQDEEIDKGSLTKEDLEEDLQKDRRAAGERDAIDSVDPTDAFARLLPGLKPNFTREPRWRPPSWRAPPMSEFLPLDKFIGSWVGSPRRSEGLTIKLMAEQYFESVEFALVSWSRLRQERIEVWLKRSLRAHGSVGASPVAEAGKLYDDARRWRHDDKTPESRCMRKAVLAFLGWGYRRGFWSRDDRSASEWLDRASLQERRVQDPYFAVRWGVVRAVYGAEWAAGESARDRDKKRKLLVNLVEAARAAAAGVQPPDIAPFPRNPSQIADPDQIRSALQRGDANLSEITITAEEMLEDFDATSRLLDKQDKRRNVWAREFVRSLARLYAVLAGKTPTGSHRHFISFVESCYRSIRPDCGALSFDHQVKSALEGTKKPRKRASYPAKRTKP